MSRASGERFAVRIVDDAAGCSDWAGLHSLLIASFAYMDGRIDPPSSLKRMSPETLAAKARDETLIVAEAADGTLAGCGFLAETTETIYLGKLAVAVQWRRRGVLRAMIAAADAVACQRGKDWLELQTRVELIENHATFAALGFEKVGETAHPGYDRATSITMRRPVDAGRSAGDARAGG
jgi:N-acetylglutamate synthase-like GNAT family acetyltransferase